MKNLSLELHPSIIISINKTLLEVTSTPNYHQALRVPGTYDATKAVWFLINLNVV